MRSPLPLAALAVAAATTLAHAGAPASDGRDARLPHRCSGRGVSATPCASDAECGGGRCVLATDKTKFTAVVTFLVDEHVGQFDDSQDVSAVAVTVLVEAVRNRDRQVFAQTFQNLTGTDHATLVQNLQTGPYIADTGNSNRRVTEASLNDATTDALLDDFLFQSGDDDIANALRTFYGSPGDPVVVKADRLERWSNGGSGLASLVRLRVRGRFTMP